MQSWNMESPDGTTFWLDDVRYVPGLTQNLFSVASGIAQNFIMGTKPNEKHVSRVRIGIGIRIGIRVLLVFLMVKNCARLSR